MLNKKILACLLLLIVVSICAISTVSATDDVADVVATSEASDDLTIDDATANELTTNFEQDLEKTAEETNDDEIIASSQEDDQLTQDQSDEILSSSSYMQYNVYLNDEYQISSYSQGTIKGTISPPPTYMPEYGFNLYVFDVNTNIVYKSKTFEGRATSFTNKIPANTLLPGEYILLAVNDYESHIMDSAVLKVTGSAVITAGNYNANYMSGTPMTATITDAKSGKPLTSASIKVVFTKGATTVTKYYAADSNGKVSFVPPVGVGTWTVKMTPGQSFITGSEVVKTATINKGVVSVAIKKITEYKGFKVTLKADVKSSGKNVNEGKVQFKINGKKYVVAVKNGVATKKIKLKKVKKYPYTAKFIKGTNLKDSKKVKSKVVMKKRLATKIIAKDQKVNTVQAKYFKVKVVTKSGKKVKGGVIKIVGKKDTPQPVKKGKAKLVKSGAVSMLFRGSNGYVYKYKKSITKKFKLKYVPGSHKYKSSKVKIKLTVTYKCPICGKKSTHYHYHSGYYSGYYTKIVVK